MKTVFIALRTAVYIIGALLLFGWVVLRLRAFDPLFGISLPQWIEFPGIILMLAAGILVLASAGIFVVRGHGTPFIADPPKEFVAQALYKHVRNPLYIGQVLLVIGAGLYLHSVSLLLFSLLWFVLLHLFVVYFEEPDLKRKFGAIYEAYCKAVPRWVPRFGHWVQNRREKL